jgi:hypothetical protein
MATNNFKELENEIVSNRDAQIKRVQNNIMHSRSLFQTIGDVVELFFPKMVDVLMKMSGGGKSSGDSNNSRYPHESN